MPYGEFTTNSLRAVLDRMVAKSVADPDAAELLALEASATITALTPSLGGYDHTIHVELTLRNLRDDWVAIDWAWIFLTDSGGYTHAVISVYGDHAILEGHTTPIVPMGVHSGSWNYGWGAGAFNLVVSVRGRTEGGERQHLIRRVPIVRPGFPRPPNIAVPSPVFVGLWSRPAEVVRMWRHSIRAFENIFIAGYSVPFLVLGGHVVNLTAANGPIRVDDWSARIVNAGKLVQELAPPKQFQLINPDGTNTPVAPAADGTVTLTGFRFRFIFGFEVPNVPADVSKATLQVELRYTQMGTGPHARGAALCAIPLAHMKPVVLRAPLTTPASGTWYWGNAPDHTDFDSHAWPGERYCFDITMQDALGTTFAGTCWGPPGGPYQGDCSVNEAFFAYGQPVSGAVDGTLVLEAHDAPQNNGYNPNPKTGAGNYILTQQPDQSVAGYFHLQPSLGPAPPFQAGKKLGWVGNSGNSSEPHLHFGLVVMHQTGRGVLAPVAFSNLKTPGGTPVPDVPGNGFYTS
jgi:hypothetical protein